MLYKLCLSWLYYVWGSCMTDCFPEKKRAPFLCEGGSL
ncbi:hypothetical protein FTV88_2734 [Heliorestis convoluta]|uniref:Uncharacterized protein n=1 Tax=Heliorestis convoluta TaxID=356322 RepID=A0A5Q2N4H2_9FIRM|nr:hypothetical protein FTV88_2734 [Heliorestis convoluta]